MATVELPRGCGIAEFAAALGSGGVLDDPGAPCVLFFPKGACIDEAALTFLGSWGRQQRGLGRELLFRGDESAIRNLMDFGLQEHLGLEFERRARDDDRKIIPLRLLSDEGDVVEAAGAICRLVAEHFENAREFRPAVEWVVGEVLDNVLRHANAADPGTHQLDSHEQTIANKRLLDG